MPEESPIISELRELLDLDADQGLEAPKAERLAQILSEHPETLDFYIEYTDQTAALQRTSGQNLSIGDGLVTSIEEGLDNHDRRGQFNYWKPWLVAASIGLVAGLSVLFNIQNRQPQAEQLITSATLTRAVNAHWTIINESNTSSVKLKSGDKLPQGRIHLAAGMAQVTFESGTALVLEAPTEFEVRGDNEAFLHQGRATARVPEGAQGFVLDTPALHVVDLGTEFALSASASGMTDVMVIEGEIEVNLPSAPLDAQPIRLLENDAMRADRTIGTLESIDLDNLPTFRRTLPSEVSLRPEATGHHWNAATNWDDNLPASPDKDYHIGGGFSQAIDTPSKGDSTFQGRSLHIDRGGILRLQSIDETPILISDLHMNRGTLKVIPPARILQLDGRLTLDGNAVIDLVDNSGRVLEITASIQSSEKLSGNILIRQAPKRQRFSTPRAGEDTFEDSRIRLLRANPDFTGTWVVEGGILEAASTNCLGTENVNLEVSSLGKLDLAGLNHTVKSASFKGEKLEPGLHTHTALTARFPMHIVGSAGTLTVRN